MAEYQMAEGDDMGDVARDLLARAGDPSRVNFYPRPNVPGGGVFEVDDDVAEAVVTQRAKVRDQERQRIENAIQAAEERDRRADETGMTPAELGFRSNAGTDPGSKVQADQAAAVTADRNIGGDNELLQDRQVATKDGTEAKANQVAADVAKTETAETAKADEDADEDDADEDADKATDEDEKPQTPAQRRAARRAAATKSDTPEDGK